MSRSSMMLFVALLFAFIGMAAAAPTLNFASSVVASSSAAESVGLTAGATGVQLVYLTGDSLSGVTAVKAGETSLTSTLATPTEASQYFIVGATSIVVSVPNALLVAGTITFTATEGSDNPTTTIAVVASASIPTVTSFTLENIASPVLSVKAGATQTITVTGTNFGTDSVTVWYTRTGLTGVADTINRGNTVAAVTAHAKVSGTAGTPATTTFVITNFILGTADDATVTYSIYVSAGKGPLSAAATLSVHYGDLPVVSAASIHADSTSAQTAVGVVPGSLVQVVYVTGTNFGVLKEDLQSVEIIVGSGARTGSLRYDVSKRVDTVALVTSTAGTFTWISATKIAVSVPASVLTTAATVVNFYVGTFSSGLTRSAANGLVVAAAPAITSLSAKWATQGTTAMDTLTVTGTGMPTSGTVFQLWYSNTETGTKSLATKTCPGTADAVPCYADIVLGATATSFTITGLKPRATTDATTNTNVFLWVSFASGPWNSAASGALNNLIVVGPTPVVTKWTVASADVDYITVGSATSLTLTGTGFGADAGTCSIWGKQASGTGALIASSTLTTVTPRITGSVVRSSASQIVVTGLWVNEATTTTSQDWTFAVQCTNGALAVGPLSASYGATLHSGPVPTISSFTVGSVTSNIGITAGVSYGSEITINGVNFGATTSTVLLYATKAGGSIAALTISAGCATAPCAKTVTWASASTIKVTGLLLGAATDDNAAYTIAVRLASGPYSTITATSGSVNSLIVGVAPTITKVTIAGVEAAAMTAGIAQTVTLTGTHFGVSATAAASISLYYLVDGVTTLLPTSGTTSYSSAKWLSSTQIEVTGLVFAATANKVNVNQIITLRIGSSATTQGPYQVVSSTSYASSITVGTAAPIVSAIKTSADATLTTLQIGTATDIKLTLPNSPLLGADASTVAVWVIVDGIYTKLNIGGSTTPYATSVTLGTAATAPVLTIVGLQLATGITTYQKVYFAVQGNTDLATAVVDAGKLGPIGLAGDAFVILSPVPTVTAVSPTNAITGQTVFGNDFLTTPTDTYLTIYGANFGGTTPACGGTVPSQKPASVVLKYTKVGDAAVTGTIEGAEWFYNEATSKQVIRAPVAALGGLTGTSGYYQFTVQINGGVVSAPGGLFVVTPQPSISEVATENPVYAISSTTATTIITLTGADLGGIADGTAAPVAPLVTNEGLPAPAQYDVRFYAVGSTTATTCGTVTWVSQTSIKCTAPTAVSVGAYYFVVTIVGGPSSAASTAQWTVIRTTEVTSVSPNTWLAGSAGTIPVTITGAGFGLTSGTITVQYALGSEAIAAAVTATSATWVSSSRVTAVLPVTAAAHLAGTKLQFWVTVGSQPVSAAVASTTTNGFISLVAPSVSCISPAMIGVGAATTVTITGTNFGNSKDNAGSVWVRATGVPELSATNLLATWVSTSQLTVTFPATTAISTAHYTFVVNLNIGSTTTYTENVNSLSTANPLATLTVGLAGLPVITSVSPTTFKQSSNTNFAAPRTQLVTINGFNFGQFNNVTVAGKYVAVTDGIAALDATGTAVTVTWVSSTQLVAAVPATLNAGVYAFTLTVGGVASHAAAASANCQLVTFEVTPPIPVVMTATPATYTYAAAASPGTVTLTGFNFGQQYATTTPGTITVSYGLGHMKQYTATGTWVAGVDGAYPTITVPLQSGLQVGAYDFWVSILYTGLSTAVESLPGACHTITPLTPTITGVTINGVAANYGLAGAPAGATVTLTGTNFGNSGLTVGGVTSSYAYQTAIPVSVSYQVLGTTTTVIDALSATWVSSTSITAVVNPPAPSACTTGTSVAYTFQVTVFAGTNFAVKSATSTATYTAYCPGIVTTVSPNIINTGTEQTITLSTTATANGGWGTSAAQAATILINYATSATATPTVCPKATWVSSTSVTCAVPAGIAAGTYVWSVSVNGLTLGFATPTLTVRQALPTITAIKSAVFIAGSATFPLPVRGWAGQLSGFKFTITGQNFGTTAGSVLLTPATVTNGVLTESGSAITITGASLTWAAAEIVATVAAATADGTYSVQVKLGGTVASTHFVTASVPNYLILGKPTITATSVTGHITTAYDSTHNNIAVFASATAVAVTFTGDFFGDAAANIGTIGTTASLVVKDATDTTTVTCSAFAYVSFTSLTASCTFSTAGTYFAQATLNSIASTPAIASASTGNKVIVVAATKLFVSSLSTSQWVNGTAQTVAVTGYNFATTEAGATLTYVAGFNKAVIGTDAITAAITLGSATSLSFTVPATALPSVYTATYKKGDESVSFTFTVTDALPTVTAVSKSSTSSIAGVEYTVTLTGTGFGGTGAYCKPALNSAGGPIDLAATITNRPGTAVAVTKKMDWAGFDAKTYVNTLTVSYSLGTTNVWSTAITAAWVSPTSLTFTMPSTAVAGDYKFIVARTDRDAETEGSGTVGPATTSAASTATLTLTPLLPTVGTASVTTIIVGTATTVTFTGSANVGTATGVTISVTARLNGVALATPLTGTWISTTSFSVPIPSTYAVGYYTFSATVAGTVGTATGGALNIIPAAPTVTEISPKWTNIGRADTTITITGTGFGASATGRTFQVAYVLLNSATQPTAPWGSKPVAGTAWTVIPTNGVWVSANAITAVVPQSLPIGAYVFAVAITDTANSNASKQGAFSTPPETAQQDKDVFTVFGNAPTVTSIRPSFGVTGVDQVVTLTGVNFGLIGVPTVTLRSAAGDIFTCSGAAFVPAGPRADAITLAQASWLVDGPTAGANTAIGAETGFGLWGNNTRANSRPITCTVPAAATGAGVSVVLGEGQLITGATAYSFSVNGVFNGTAAPCPGVWSGFYSQTANPAIAATDSFSPSWVNTGVAGTVVTITGVQLIAGMTATVTRQPGNEQISTGIEVTLVTDSVTKATFIMPSVTQDGRYDVTLTSGAYTSLPRTFLAYNGAPTVTAVSPATAISGKPGTVVTLTGNNFVATYPVRKVELFRQNGPQGGQQNDAIVCEGAAFTAATTPTIICTLPARLPIGQYTFAVTLVTPTGERTGVHNGGLFGGDLSVVGLPYVLAASPVSAIAGTATTVTLSGVGFGAANGTTPVVTVTMGSTVLTGATWVAEATAGAGPTIVVTVPAATVVVGAYTFTVNTYYANRDGAFVSQTGPASASLFTVYTAAPTVTSVSPAVGVTGIQMAVRVAVVNAGVNATFSTATFTVTAAIGSGTPVTCTGATFTHPTGALVGTGFVSCLLPALTATGDYVFTVAPSGTGSIGTAVAGGLVTVTDSPYILYNVPSQGPAGSVNTVTLNGVNFGSTAAGPFAVEYILQASTAGAATTAANSSLITWVSASQLTFVLPESTPAGVYVFWVTVASKKNPVAQGFYVVAPSCAPLRPPTKIGERDTTPQQNAATNYLACNSTIPAGASCGFTCAAGYFLVNVDQQNIPGQLPQGNNCSSPSLGEGQGYAALSGVSISSTGLTFINGDIGLAGGSATTAGLGPINGFGGAPGVINNGAIAVDSPAAGLTTGASVTGNAGQAWTDLGATWTRLNAITGAQDASVPAAGASISVTPGVYKFAALAEFGAATTITFNGTGIFIIQFTAGVNTAANVKFALERGATAGCVYWVVAGAATFGASNTLIGNILVSGAVSFGAGSSLTGLVYARTGALSLSTTTITVAPACDRCGGANGIGANGASLPVVPTANTCQYNGQWTNRQVCVPVYDWAVERQGCTSTVKQANGPDCQRWGTELGVTAHEYTCRGTDMSTDGSKCHHPKPMPVPCPKELTPLCPATCPSSGLVAPTNGALGSCANLNGTSGIPAAQGRNGTAPSQCSFSCNAGYMLRPAPFQPFVHPNGTQPWTQQQIVDAFGYRANFTTYPFPYFWNSSSTEPAIRPNFTRCAADGTWQNPLQCVPIPAQSSSTGPAPGSSGASSSSGNNQCVPLQTAGSAPDAAYYYLTIDTLMRIRCQSQLQTLGMGLLVLFGVDDLASGRTTEPLIVSSPKNTTSTYLTGSVGTESADILVARARAALADTTHAFWSTPFATTMLAGGASGINFALTCKDKSTTATTMATCPDVVVPATPAITTITPTSGYTTVDTTITINGVNFGASAADFAGITCAPAVCSGAQWVSATQARITIYAGQLTVGQKVSFTPAFTGAATATLQYTGKALEQVTFALKVNVPIATANTDTWKQNYISEMASVLGVTTSRITILSITAVTTAARRTRLVTLADAVNVQTSIINDPNSATSANAAVSTLQTMIATPTSALYTQTSTLSATDSAQTLTVSYKCADGSTTNDVTTCPSFQEPSYNNGDCVYGYIYPTTVPCSALYTATVSIIAIAAAMIFAIMTQQA